MKTKTEKTFIGILYVLFQALLVTLKILGILTFSWAAILFPLWGLTLFTALVFSIAFLIAAVQTMIENIRG